MANYQKQLQSIGFSYDTLTANGYNKINGFCFTVKINPNTKDYVLTVACRPQDETAYSPLQTMLQQFSSERKKVIKTAVFDGKQIIICWNMAGFSTDITANVKEYVNFITYCINQFGLVPCCSSCGRQEDTSIYAIEQNVAALCSGCFNKTQMSMAGNMYNEAKNLTNYPLGIVGSVLGGLAGAVVWILFSMMGRIVPIAGALAGLGGYFGFKWLGKKMTLKGLIISIAVSLIFLLAGMYVATGIDVFNVLKDWGYDISFSEAFELIPYFMEDSDFVGAVVYNNIFGVIMFIVGAVCCIGQYHMEKKVKNRMLKLV